MADINYVHEGAMTDEQQPTFFQQILAAFHPLELAAGILLYWMGGGLAVYLGRPMVWGIYWLGQGVVILLLAGIFSLTALFDEMDAEKTRSGKQKFTGISKTIWMQISFTLLALGSLLTVIMVFTGRMSVSVWLMLGIAFVFMVVLTVPPFRLAKKGYRELLTGVLITYLFPTIAFLLLTGENHRMLLMLSIPLLFLYLASTLAFALESYARDMKKGTQTLLLRLGWQRGMNFHHLLVLSAFLLILVMTFIGFPWRIAWRGLLALPFGLYQIWSIWQINQGAKPRWKLLRLNAGASFGLLAYFFLISLWMG